MSNNEHEHVYNIMSQSQRLWLQQAHYLRICAEKLFEEFEDTYQNHYHDMEKMLAFSHGFMLQMGFAFENLIKGVHISQTLEISPDDRFKLWSRCSGGHDLIALSVLANIQLSDREKDMLDRMTVYSTWAGRYLLPTNLNKYESAVTQRRVTIVSTDDVVSDQLFERLADIIRNSKAE